MEKSDILSTYNKVCQDNERLQENSKQLGTQNRDLFQRV